MNEIDKKQLEPRMLNLLRARTLIYRRAKNVQAVGFAISLGFPILGLVVSAYLPPGEAVHCILRPYLRLPGGSAA